ncbi:MAG: ABC transporter substrate-binding protein [Rhodospirillales bacterium]|nr:ABC transporter substrate-binding protein [Rhodospirillales bacterium]MDE2199120.1 ABC transporter substrate-binding protein [Rhodospirillales bacterium]MDE2573769.1 ABC transporter substrate-binding protein [Rhodospirillales bacterium]
MTHTMFRRRTLLAAGTGALFAPYVARGAGALQPAKVSIGRIPWAAFNSPMTQYMIENKLMEKRAAELGIALTIDWREYPTALPMVEAIVGNNLDMGMWGNTPIIRALVAKLPLSLMVVGEGHLRFVLTTRKGSPIKTIQDIKGKTVGALLGGDPYNALTEMLHWEMGSADPRDFGIRIINTPTLAQAAEVPKGMDAAIAIYPAYLQAAHQQSIGIMNSFGYSEAGYDGPLGHGAGIMFPSVKKSPFYPDGYYLHRSFWIANNHLLDKNPKIALAFVIAQQDAVTALAAMQPGPVSQLVKQYWKLDSEDGGKVVTDDVLYHRGWAWPTESDARAVLVTSKYLTASKMIDKPLDWAQVKEAFARTAPLLKQAYDHFGDKPPAVEFVRTNAGDLRGLPVWNMDQWSVPG